MVFIFVILLFLSASPPVAESSDQDSQDLPVGLSLTTVIDRALSTHPQILAKQKGINEALGLMRQAGLRPNPSVQFTAGTSAILGESGDQEWSAEYVHTFELGNKRRKRLGIAEIGLMISKLQLQDQKRQLALEINKQFADFISTRLILEATNRSVLHKYEPTSMLSVS